MRIECGLQTFDALHQLLDRAVELGIFLALLADLLAGMYNRCVVTSAKGITDLWQRVLR